MAVSGLIADIDAVQNTHKRKQVKTQIEIGAKTAKSFDLFFPSQGSFPLKKLTIMPIRLLRSMAPRNDSPPRETFQK